MKVLKIKKENYEIVMYLKKRLFEKIKIDFQQFFICEDGTFQPYRYEIKGNIVCIKWKNN